MHVLAIMGSPNKKGHTYQVTREVESAMQALGEVEFTYLFLRDVNLEPCRGCFQCVTKGEQHCPIKDDDREAIVQQMAAVDGVILASPNYVGAVSGLTKSFIDRLAYVCHRPAFFGKDAMVISTSAGPYGLDKVLEYLTLPLIAWGFKTGHKVGVVAHPLAPSPKSERESARAIKAAAEGFYRALAAPTRPAPSFSQLMQLRAMRLNASLAKDDFPADYAYYIEQDPFAGMKITLPQELMLGLQEAMMKRFYRQNFVVS